MKRVLIIGASILQLPAIRKAKELGYYVGVADYNPNAKTCYIRDPYELLRVLQVQKLENITSAILKRRILEIMYKLRCKGVAIERGVPEVALALNMFRCDFETNFHLIVKYCSSDEAEKVYKQFMTESNF